MGFVRIKILLASKCAQAKLKEKVILECEIERTESPFACIIQFTLRAQISISDMEREIGWEKRNMEASLTRMAKFGLAGSSKW